MGKLTALRIAREKRVGMHGDGGGLYLQVSPAGTGKSLAHLVMNWPMLPPGELPILPGRVIHLVVQHDHWCRTLNSGTGADCNCNPVMSAHVQPLGAALDINRPATVADISVGFPR